MISALKRFLADLTGEPEPKPIGADENRLAAATLLYHVTAIDGVVGDDERARLRTLLKDRFDLAAMKIGNGGVLRCNRRFALGLPPKPALSRFVTFRLVRM